MPISAPATVTRNVQIGMESSYGTVVAATKRLQSANWIYKPNAMVQTYRAPGNKHNAEGRLTQDWSTAKLSGVPSYTEIIYYLAMLVKGGVTPSVVGTSTQKWVFAGSPNAPDVPGSATLELGDSVRGQHIAGNVLTGISMDFGPDKTALAGDALGQLLTDPFTPTPSLSYVPKMEIVGKDVNVYIDPTAAALGTTQQLGIMKTTFSVANRFSPLWLLNRANASFDSVVEDAPDFKMQLTVPANSEGMAHLTRLRSTNNSAFLRIGCLGPQTESGQNYLLNIDMCGYVSATNDITDNNKVIATVWEYTCQYDPTWNLGYEFTVQNLQAAL